MLKPARPHWPRINDGHFMHVGAFLQVSGTARAPEGLPTETQRRAESRDKALVDAWQRLLSYIHNLPLPGFGYVKVRAQEDPAFAKRLETLVYSSQVVETRYSGDLAAVVIRVAKSDINKVLNSDFR